MNTRANIMFFVETLCIKSREGGHSEPIGMMQRDMWKIVDGVAPPDASGAANVKIVRKVVNDMARQDFLTKDLASDIQDRLKNRAAAPSPSEEIKSKHSVPSGSSSRRRAIQDRIEADRERHKKARETSWAIHSDNHAEIEQLWDDASDVDDDDYMDGQEDLAERHRAAVAAG